MADGRRRGSGTPGRSGAPQRRVQDHRQADSIHPDQEPGLELGLNSISSAQGVTVQRCVRLALIVFAWLTIVPATARAQASITGAVRDTSGAVLPGVTVEATSPALIERVRSVVTDGTGQYRIENLRPGVFTVTFTLPGFATVKREGIELTGAFTATVNGELRVGAVEETVTVSGETPTVDVQSTTQQRVLDTQL